MLNIAKLIRDRMIMQNKADNAALSLATYKARVLNFLSSTNYLIGFVLSMGMEPTIVQMPSFSTKGVGGLPDPVMFNFGQEYFLSDIKHDCVAQPKNSSVHQIKLLVDGLIGMQNTAIQEYHKYCIAVCKDAGTALGDSYKDYIVQIVPIPNPVETKPEKYLGLKRNSKKVQYLKTLTLECIYSDMFYHFHSTGHEKYREGSSWLVEDENFYDQKISVVVGKKKKSGYTPLFAKLLDIQFPTIIAFSAAAPYNAGNSKEPKKKITGFPKTEENYTGNTTLSGSLVWTTYGVQMAALQLAVVNIYSLIPYPPAAAAVAATIEGFVGAAGAYAAWLQEENKDKDNPITAYEDSVNSGGGWAAHLVPFKTQKKQDED